MYLPHGLLWTFEDRERGGNGCILLLLLIREHIPPLAAGLSYCMRRVFDVALLPSSAETCFLTATETMELVDLISLDQGTVREM